MRRGYAILDFETTGFSPARNDRIIEVGAIYMDPDFRIDGGIETLVNPQRDVGPTHVHGITAREVFDAPTFDQVAPALLKLLDGRVVVGHNIAFDLRFLTAELEREGYEVPDIVAIDTMQIARTLLQEDPPPSFKLHDLGQHLGFGIKEVFDFVNLEQRPAHSAFGDSLVTAFVLSHLARNSSRSNYWISHLDAAESLSWPEYFQVEVEAKRRIDQSTETANQPVSDTLGSITDVLTALGAEAPSREKTAEYSGYLDHALTDRILDASEIETLVKTALKLGLDSVTLGSLHRGYFDEVVRAAWSDGVLTAEEHTDIVGLSEILGIDGDSLRSALQSHTRPMDSSIPSVTVAEPLNETVIVIPPGSIVVLTGEMTVDRVQAENKIIALGHAIGNNVTKKTTIVIAADPYTQSGKAKKARGYGIPVVGEVEGFQLIGI
ncbi:MAG: exonuclease domain-containing protein [Leucobacter sp.]